MHTEADINKYVTDISDFLSKTISTLKRQDAYVLPIYVKKEYLEEMIKYRQNQEPSESESLVNWPEKYKDIMIPKFDAWKANIGTQLNNLLTEAEGEIKTHADNMRRIVGGRKAPINQIGRVLLIAFGWSLKIRSEKL